jgi:hypothetical protein
MTKSEKDFLARWSIGRAMEGDDEMLGRRLREVGVASPEEMAAAADLFQKKAKVRHPRRGDPNWTMNYAITSMVLLMEAGAYPPMQYKAVVSWVAEQFNVSPSHVYDLMKERGLAKKEDRRLYLEQEMRDSEL